MLANYINLRNAQARRMSLELNIQTLPAGQWELRRYDAVGTDHEACGRIAGRTSAAEKACYLSHLGLLTKMVEADGRYPFMVWEDDVVVGRFTHQTVSSFVSQAAPGAWDILYTDVVVPDLASMLDLLKRGRAAREQGRCEVINLRTMGFAGTTSYLVNPVALPRLVQRLNSIPSLDEPLDLLLRRWIHQGDIQGHVLYPFVTTVSDAGLNSQIAPGSTHGTDLAWTLFRKLMWMERDIQSLYPLCNQLASLHADAESSVMGVIAAALLSPQFRPK